MHGAEVGGAWGRGVGRGGGGGGGGGGCMVLIFYCIVVSSLFSVMCTGPPFIFLPTQSPFLP